VLGPFDWPQVTQAGARGAALLAGIAAGQFAGIGDLPDPPALFGEPIGDGPVERDGPVPRPTLSNLGQERSQR
jgi:hypothetical protein